MKFEFRMINDEFIECPAKKKERVNEPSLIGFDERSIRVWMNERKRE